MVIKGYTVYHGFYLVKMVKPWLEIYQILSRIFKEMFKIYNVNRGFIWQ